MLKTVSKFAAIIGTIRKAILWMVLPFFALWFGSLHCLTPRKVRPLVGLFWRFGQLRQSL